MDKSYPPKKNSNGAKAFAGVMSIMFLATVCWMLWQSQNSNIDTLERLTNQRLKLMEKDIAEIRKHIYTQGHPVVLERIEDVRDDIVRNVELMHEDDFREVVNAERMEALRNQLLEVETQFRNDDRFIRLLWQKVYAEPLPAAQGNNK